ncbi:hypothetical protein Y1Q_0010533 [Alligator mississippiensis]|uniref:C-type lectin domain-containing protein n=1 Tax=Alligator mississippiensis TaxID=8496 RepID=A0A151NDB4_ALLMI|nr:hypothetical protein Y1Q_0010533 [Alligator mississippiensis]
MPTLTQFTSPWGTLLFILLLNPGHCSLPWRYSQPSPESLPAESKPAALDLLGMHGQDDASSDLRLETPPELQRQIPRHAGHREPAPASPPWSPIPLVLGIMLVCLLFLITARVYGAQMAQLGIERKSLLEQVGYLSSELTSCQNQGIPGTVRELPHDIGTDVSVCQPGTEKENPVMEGKHHTPKPTSYQKPSPPGTSRKQPQDTGEKCPALWTAKQDRVSSPQGLMNMLKIVEVVHTTTHSGLDCRLTSEKESGSGQTIQLFTLTYPSATPLRWQLATLVLGILCLILLTATAVLGYNVCQPGTEQENPVKEGEQHTSQPTSYQKPSLPGTSIMQPQDTGQKYAALWTAKQDRSYLFAPQRGTWKQYRGSSLYYYPFWIGLSFDSRKAKWVWADASAVSSGLFVLLDPSPQNYPGGACAYLQGDKVKLGGCGENQFCICKKKKEAQIKNKVD